MPETSNNLGAPGIAERLSALRTAQSSPITGGQRQPKRIRTELLIGFIVILAGVTMAIFLRGGKGSVIVNETVQTKQTTITTDESRLMAGEALVAVAIDVGNFPPSLAPGDTVRVVVTPSNDGSGTVHSLKEITVVQSVSAPSDMNNQFVVTMRSEESLATAIAGSGPVHLSIIKGKQL
jgi:hypothetical protein